MKRVFLGGTCNESTWRNDLIPQLKIGYFNPVVDDWDEEAQQQEIKERKACDFCLYVITPRMHGAAAVAEAVDDSNKRPEKTVFCVLQRDDWHLFDDRQMRSWKHITQMILDNGARSFDNLVEVAAFLNS